MKSPRIVSFLPAATEVLGALGLLDSLVGISHECDYPPEVRAKPVVVRPALPLEKMTLREIDESVSARLREGHSLYVVDEKLLCELEPDLIITQDLCQVCAPSGNEITQALKCIAKKPRILSLTPRCLDEIIDNLVEIGLATCRTKEAAALIADSRARMERVGVIARGAANKPRVFCMEWPDPVYCCGHWVPEMIKIAGGEDALAREGTESVRIPWADVVQWAPEILVIMPCGFSLSKTLELVPRIFAFPGISELPAMRAGRVYAVDANAYFARPGPRVVEGTELLAHLIHPELFSWNGARDAFAPVEIPR